MIEENVLKKIRIRYSRKRIRICLKMKQIRRPQYCFNLKEDLKNS